MVKNTVKLIEFKISKTKREEVENKLAELLDDGYDIAGQHEAEGWLVYTLVRKHSQVQDIPYGADGTPVHTALH